VTTAENLNQRLFMQHHEKIVTASCSQGFESWAQSMKVRNVCRLQHVVGCAFWI